MKYSKLLRLSCCMPGAIRVARKEDKAPEDTWEMMEGERRDTGNSYLI
jgi:hypothetical protein